MAEPRVNTVERRSVRVPVRGLLWSCLGAIGAMNLLNAVAVARQPWNGGALAGTADWLLLTSEGNPSTWLAGAIWLASSGVAVVSGVFAPRDQRRRWNELAVVLTLLSIDEVASVHEKLDEWLGIEGGSLVPYAWVIPASVGVAVLAVRLTPFVVGLARTTRRAIAGGFGLLLLGAVGVETMAGRWDDQHGADNFTYHGISAIEENLEYAGGVVVLIGLLHALRSHATRVSVALD